jgi:glycosyltransferase involved in cell wall biosynthesis
MNIASGIIVNSYQTLTTLTNYLKKTNTACPPIINAHLGQTNFPKNNSYTLSGDKKYFIIIGTIEPRKNIWFILNLWKEIIERLSNDAPYLVIIGKRGWECENVIDLLERCEIIKSRIIEISSAKDDELQNWLRNSIALLFPSFIEGYGIPLIEAISQKVPVIASNLPIFHEIVGNTPDYIHPLDGPKWIDTIINYTNDNSLLRNKQIERLQTFNLPTWDEHFKKVENFLSTI